MVKKHMKGHDGKYHIKGQKYDLLCGSRAQVWHKTAYKTKGNLKKDNLLMNKHGRVVSKKKHITAKRDKPLIKAGFYTRKGHFGFVRKDGTKSKKRGSKKGTKKRRRN